MVNLEQRFDHISFQRNSLSFLGIGKSHEELVILRLQNEVLSCCFAVFAALWTCIASGCSFQDTEAHNFLCSF